MRALAISIVLLYALGVVAQPTFKKPIVFNRYGCTPGSVLELPDGFIVASYGYTRYTGALGYRSGIVLHRTDSSGDVRWVKTYSQAGKGIGIGLYGSLQPTIGGYLLCGSIYDTLTTNTDFFLCKIDTAGEVLWLKTYSLPNRIETAFHGSATADGGYIMIGERGIPGNVSSYDYYVVRTNGLGNVKWQKTYSSGAWDRGLQAHQLKFGQYLISGVSESFTPGGGAWLLRLDSLGDELWSDSYGTAGADAFGKARPSSSGYLLWGGGDTLVYNTETQYNKMIFKTDFNGVVQWRTFFNHQKRGWIDQVRELHDGSIVAIGEQRIGRYGDSTAAWIAKLNPGGDVLWERFHPGPVGEDSLWGYGTFFNGDFQPTSDGGFIIAGSTWRGTDTNPLGYHWHPWLVKLDSNGCFGTEGCGLYTGIEERPEYQVSKQLQITIFPNPASEFANMYIKGNSAQWANVRVQITLYDMSGRQQHTESRILNPYSYTETQLKTAHLPPGVYVYAVTGNKERLGEGKIVVE